MKTNRYEEVKKIGILGIVANIFLLTIKLMIAVVCKSQGMIADTLNSALDIFASFMTYIGSRVSEIPSDESHPHGHEKAEYLFSFTISLVMIGTTISIIINSFKSIIEKQEFEISKWIYVICLITIVIKFCMWIYTRSKYKKYKNILILANSEDHRNDLFLTTGTLIGIVFAENGYYFVDGIMGILISTWICYVAINIMRESNRVLMDSNLCKDEIDSIEKIIMKNEHILHVDKIIAKPTGIKYMLLIKLSMDGNLSLNKSHKQAGIIKEKILNEKKDTIADVIIHINPH